MRGRRLAFGLSTLLGVARRGFFIPYRHAASVEPLPYPGLAPLFEAAEPTFLAVLDAMEAMAPDLAAIGRDGGRARFDQTWFPALDGAAAYAIVRRHRPRRIVEIGSGHSTRFLARAAADGALGAEIVCIDPQPRRSLEGLGVRHEARLLDDGDRPLFEALAADDVLFIDSSHVAMPGSDVDRLFLDVLPRLAPGVLVHVHDVLLPDPYPEAWAWRGYNEQLLAGALIQGTGYELVFASHWVRTRMAERVRAGVAGTLPLVPGAMETSLWLRKRA